MIAVCGGTLFVLGLLMVLMSISLMFVSTITELETNKLERAKWVAGILMAFGIAAMWLGFLILLEHG